MFKENVQAKIKLTLLLGTIKTVTEMLE